MPRRSFELENYADGDGIRCTDGSDYYLIYFAIRCLGIDEGRGRGSGDDEQFDTEDAYRVDFELLDCEAVLDDEEAVDKIGWNPDYSFASEIHNVTLDNCKPEAKEMWRKLKTEDGLSIIEAIKALADENAWEIVDDSYAEPTIDYAEEHMDDFDNW